jgi:IMP dehydrogenase
MTLALTYDDILLIPQYSDIKSRKEVDIGNNLDNKIYLDLPVISSPMDTVTESAMVTAISNQGGIGIIHRYNSIEEQTVSVQAAAVRETQNIGAAIGVTGDFLERASAVHAAGANVLCVDVAHGHHILMKEALSALRKFFSDDLHIMAGNVATQQAFNDLSDWGANSIRCNIGGGSICSTRIQTGHGLPGLQTIIDCSKSTRKAKIIADGGIRTSGDIVKAFAAGADFVMLGSLLAGTNESPGEEIQTPTGLVKKYRGMASKDAQMDWRGRTSSEEGISTLIDHKGPVTDILESIKNGISSGFSYSGARTINEFREKVKWVQQTSAGLSEGRTHILP